VPRESFPIGPVRVRAGSARNVELPITKLVTGADISLPVRILHGKEDGPVVWVDAAIHGDEVSGIEVIHEVLDGLSASTLRGTLIAVPIVNVIGFLNGDRYLPDRRDLNRSFPGSARGSLASRVAHLMMTEVVGKCEVGIDLHSGSDGRSNLPQIRADLDDPRTRGLAEAFGAPVMYHAKLRDGSLRWAAREQGATVLLYEAGEAWRMDPWAVDSGVAGVQRVLAALDMIDPVDRPTHGVRETRSSGWVRARRTGLLRLDVELGQEVDEGDRLGGLYDSFGRTQRLVRADRSGVVIGLAKVPLVNSGDALVHIAQ